MAKALKTIMCVDDEEDILEVASMSLELLGDYTVWRCNSGVQALADVARAEPDLILMDVMMPELDGPGAMKRIHAMPGLERLPVVFMTAHVQPEQQRALIDLGAVSCISKPFDPTALAGTVESIWAGIQAERARAGNGPADSA